MNFYTQKILILIAYIVSMITFSCSTDNMSEVFPSDPIEGDGSLSFNIKIMGASVSSSANSKIEKIKSLRIIIIDSEGNLEINESVNLETSEYEVSNFSYTFKKSLNEKEKKLFLIGNEESVGKVSLTDNEDLPENIPLRSLSYLLDYFTPGGQINGVRSGEILEKVLNRVYYENNYLEVIDDSTKEKTPVSNETSIYLPYSAFYKLDSSEFGFSRLNNPLFLVPVATKIDFNIVSYRSHDTLIEDILICSVNNNNFINAQLSDKEIIRTFEEKDYWWIDWLEECSRNSHTTSDLEEFNKRWGWIEDYKMPVEEQTVEKGLYSDLENKNNWTVEKMVDKNNPDRKYLGPFYLPESKNPDYTLTFKVYDTTTKEETILEGYALDTVKTLFRGTHIMVNVELYERAMDIYAEIVPWTMKVFLGYVQQDDDD